MLEELNYKATASDLTTEASRVKALKADVFLINGYYGDTVLWMKTLRDLQVDFKAIVGLPNPALSNPNFVKDEPKLAEFMMDTNYWWDPTASAPSRSATPGRRSTTSRWPTTRSRPTPRPTSWSTPSSGLVDTEAPTRSARPWPRRS